MGKMNQCVAAAAIGFGLALTAAPASAISLGMVNTFEGATTEGWHVAGSHPSPPVVVDTGGPAGVGDGYMQLRSTTAGGAGSRLAGIAGDAWDGNYLAVGVTSIEVDVNNQGTSDLQLRLFVCSGLGCPFTNNAATSTVGINVPAGSGWIHLAFPLTAGTLTGATPASDPALTLSNVTELRLFHNTDPSHPPGSGIIATLGVDNITAVAPIPEPATAWLWAVGLGAVALRAARGAQRGKAAAPAPT